MLPSDCISFSSIRSRCLHFYPHSPARYPLSSPLLHPLPHFHPSCSMTHGQKFATRFCQAHGQRAKSSGGKFSARGTQLGGVGGARAIRFSKNFSDFCSRGPNHLILHLERPGRLSGRKMACFII